MPDLEHVFHLLRVHCVGSSSKGDVHLRSTLAVAAPSSICRNSLHEAISLLRCLCCVTRQGGGCSLGHHQEGLQRRGGHVWGGRHLVQRELPPNAKAGQEHACTRQGSGVKRLPEHLVQEGPQLHSMVQLHQEGPETSLPELAAIC